MSENITRLGVLGSPALAQTLTNHGIDVVSNDVDLVAASLINEANIRLVLVLNSPSLDPFLKAWAETKIADKVRFVVFGSDGALSGMSETVYIDTPMSLGDVLVKAGFDFEKSLALRQVMFPATDSAEQASKPEPTSTPTPAPMPSPPAIPAAHQVPPTPAPVDTVAPTPAPNPMPRSVPTPVSTPSAAPVVTQSVPVPVSAPSAVEVPPAPTPVPTPIEVNPAPVEVAPVLAEPTPVDPSPVPIEPAPVDLSQVPIEPIPVEVAPVLAEPTPVPIEPTPAPVEDSSFQAFPAVDDTPTPAPYVPPAAVVSEAPSFTPPIATVVPQPQVAHSYMPPALTLNKAQGQVLFSFAAKGGVLKTTTAIATAQRAANAGLKVTLIDANRGQGDIDTVLRIPQCPTIYDFAIGAPIEDIHLSPERIGSMRPTVLEKVNFAFIAAPRDGTSDKNIVTSQVYREAIDYARSVSDLVVIDTQIAEDTDNSGLFDEVFIPLMRDDAWVLALSDASVQSIDNIFSRIAYLEQRHGVDPGRILFLMTRLGEKEESIAEEIANTCTAMATPMGFIKAAHDAVSLQSTGSLLADHEAFAPVLDSVLFAVTGKNEFAATTTEHTRAPRARVLSKLWRRK